MTVSTTMPRPLGRRIALSLFAFLLGVATSVAAVRLSQADDGAEKPGTVLGTVDVDAYCSDIHGVDAVPVLIRRDPGGWHCAIRDNGIFGTVAIDHDRACATQFAQIAHGDKSAVSWPYLWQCIAGQRTAG